jgi:sugar/nucleoside kinase (ribokinase family)
MIDVFCYGMISASTVYVLENTFPHPNEYAEIKNVLLSIGGEAVNSAIMLSRFGKSTKLDGNWLNPAHAQRILNQLTAFKIDVSRLTTKPNYGTEEIVITDKNSRTVFGNYSSFHHGEKQWNTPHEADIRNANLVCLDPYFRDDSLTIAEMCVKNEKPYVTLDCRYDSYLARHAAAVIVSHELRDQAYSDCSMEQVFKHYQSHCSGLVIFTFGSDDMWYGRQGQQVKKFQPYKITPVDTTGAGDSFRSGIIYGLLNSWVDERTIDFASAVAACVCLTVPHTLNAPGLAGIEKFMNNRSKI